MSVLISHLLGDWRYLVEKPASAEGVERTVEKGSVPSYAFFFMLASSGVIATFGLLANSAAVIIGAMIVAPLMNPIISMSFGIMAGRGLSGSTPGLYRGQRKRQIRVGCHAARANHRAGY